MPFDLEAARKAGASDAQIADFLASKANFDVVAAREAGATDTQLVDFLMKGREKSTQVAGPAATEAGAGRGFVNPPAGGPPAPRRGGSRSEFRPFVGGDARAVPEGSFSVNGHLYKEPTVSDNAFGPDGDTTIRRGVDTIAPSPEPSMLGSAFRALDRKPLDQSLGGAVLETLGDAGRGMAKVTPGLATSLWGGIQAGADVVGAENVAGVAGEAAGAGRRHLSQFDNPNGDKLVTGALQSLGTALAGGAAFGVPGAVGTAVGQTAGDKYAELRSRGFDVDASLEAATVHGIAEYVGERIGMPSLGRLVSGLAQKTGMKPSEVFKEALKQQGEEQATLAIQDVYDKFGRGSTRQDMTFDDYVNDVVDTAKQTAIMSAVAAGGGRVARAAAPAPQQERPRVDPPTLVDKAIDEAASGFGLSTKATVALRDKVKGLSPAKAVQVVARAFEGFERAGLTKKPGAKDGFLIGLQQQVDDASKAAEQPADAPAAAPEGGIAGDFTGPDAAAAEAPADALIEPSIEQQLQQDLARRLGVADQPAEDQTGGAPGDGAWTSGSTPAPVATEGGYFTELDTPAPAFPIEGEAINRNWSRFAPESGSLDIPREQMPQIKAEHRGALVNFLNARGVQHQEETVDPASLKPTQAEFSPKKVKAASEYAGGDRAVLVSQDGHVIDGTHQWLAARDAGRSIRVIRLDAPVQDLLRLSHQFPSSTTAGGPYVTREDGMGEARARSPAVGGEAAAAVRQGPGRGQTAVRGTDAGAVLELGNESAPAGRPATHDIATIGTRSRAPTVGQFEPGQRVSIDGMPYTVKAASPRVVRLAGDDGRARVITSDSANWAKVKPVERLTASWVIREKDTGKVVMETFDRAKVDALNTARYEAIPVQQHLASLNKSQDTAPAPVAEEFSGQRVERRPEGKVVWSGRRPSASHPGAEAPSVTGKSEPVDSTPATGSSENPAAQRAIDSPSGAPAPTPLARIADQTGVSDLADGDNSLLSRARQPVSRRTAASTTGTDPAQLRAMVDDIRRSWTDAPPAEVVDTTADLPADIQHALRSMNAWGIARALVLPDSGKVFLISDRLQNLGEAQFALFHEVLGHYGLRKVLGREVYHREMALLRIANPALKAEADAWMRSYAQGQIRARIESGATFDEAAQEVRALSVEEALADRAGNPERLTGFKAFLARLQKALRRMGLGGAADWLEARTEAETLELLARARAAVERGGEIHAYTGQPVPALSRRDATPVALPRAVIGNTLGAATRHPDYVAAKGGDPEAAYRLARDLVTDDVVQKVRAAIGDAKPIVQGVAAEEASGRNKIPQAVAEVLADRLGLTAGQEIVQANTPKRTGMDGLDRLFAAPEFDGEVEPGRDYLLVDDTLTQGGTFAALAAHIRQGGGNAIASFALTGKQYSSTMALDPSLLDHVRRLYGTVEEDFIAATGYGFDALTESEARYLVKHNAPDSVRDRIVARGNEARAREAESDDQGGQAPLLSQAPRRSPEQAGGPRTLNGSGSLLSSAAGATGAPPQSASQTTTAAPSALPEESPFRSVQRKLQDSLNRFTVLRNWLQEQGVTLTDTSNVWEFEERMHGRIATRTEDFREKVVKPAIEAITKAGYRMGDVAEFLHAQHAQERNEQIEKIDLTLKDGSGMATADAQAIISKADPEMVKLANKLQAITNDTRKILVDAGIITQEMADAWQQAYKHYVPLKGIGDPPAQAGKALNVNGRQRRALGHVAREEFIVENILRDHERAIMLAEKNVVGHSLLKFVMEADNPNIATIGEPEKRRVLAAGAPGYEVVDASGAAVQSFDALDDAVGFVRASVQQDLPGAADLGVQRVSGDPMVKYMARPQLADNEAQVYVNGHAVRVQLNDALLARAYLKMGVENLGKLLRFNREVNRFLSQVYTAFNPEFLPTNMVRDLTAGTVNIAGKYGAGVTAKTIANYPMAFAQMLAHSYTGKAMPMVDEYRKAGGSTGAAYLSDIERIGKDVQAAHDDYKGALATASEGRPLLASRIASRKMIRGMTALFEHLNAAGENAFRVAVFNAVKNTPGKTVNDAASAAKNSTVNFNRRGEWTQALGGFYLFFNPAVQGVANMVDTLTNGEHRAQAWALLGGAAALGFALRGQWEDEEGKKLWRRIPQYEKDHNILIRTGGDTYLKIPIPYDYGFFYTLGNHLYDLKHGAPVDEVALKIALSAFSSFSPIDPFKGGDPSAGGMVELIPGVFGGELFRDVARLSANRDGLGRQIVPDSKFDEGKPDNRRMNRATKGSAYDKVASGLNQLTGGTQTQAGAIDVSPEMLKFWTQQLTGGLGRSIVDTIGLVKRTVDYANAKTDEERAALKPSLAEIPVVRRFAGEETIQSTRGSFWDAAKEVDQAVDDFKRAHTAGDKDGLSKLEQKRVLVSLGHMLERQKKMASALRNQIDKVENDPKTSDGYKRVAIKALEKREGEVYGKFLDAFDAAQAASRTPAPQSKPAAAADLVH